MTVIAWAYMVELEDGLSKDQVNKLLELAPAGTDVFPFSLEGGSAPVEANSMAIGFINNEYFDEIGNVQMTLANVCNDWDNERDDQTYILDSEDEDEEDALKVIMLCDYKTLR
jgi:hypothetical protein